VPPRRNPLVCASRPDRSTRVAFSNSRDPLVAPASPLVLGFSVLAPSAVASDGRFEKPRQKVPPPLPCVDSRPSTFSFIAQRATGISSLPPLPLRDPVPEDFFLQILMVIRAPHSVAVTRSASFFPLPFSMSPLPSPPTASPHKKRNIHVKRCSSPPLPRNPDGSRTSLPSSMLLFLRVIMHFSGFLNFFCIDVRFFLAIFFPCPVRRRAHRIFSFSPDTKFLCTPSGS